MAAKIAFPTDDGETISRHFGQARYFKVVMLLDRRIGASELRDKANHRHGQHTETEVTHPGQLMVETVADCQAVISGGMGTPMLARLEAAGLNVYLTSETSIGEAAKAFLEGTLKHEPGLVHQSHAHDQ